MAATFTTLADLRESVYGRIDDNSAFWPESEVDGAINEALRVVNLFTGFNQGYVQVPNFSVAGKVFYDYPVGLIYPVQVWFEKKPLRKSSLSKIGAANPYWLRDTTASTGGTVEDWVPIGLSKFAIHPADAEGGGDIRIFGVLETSEMSEPDALIPLNDEFAAMITDYAAHLLPVKEGGRPFNEGTVYYPAFQKKMLALAKWQKLKMPKFQVEREAKS